MFALRLNARACISCGICMDVCPPRAISMRTASRKCVEGACLALYRMGSFGQPRPEPALLMTFPYLAIPERCDGCGPCV
jgi:ferredoxin